jgi:hypothetical protein
MCLAHRLLSRHGSGASQPPSGLASGRASAWYFPRLGIGNNGSRSQSDPPARVHHAHAGGRRPTPGEGIVGRVRHTCRALRRARPRGRQKDSLSRRQAMGGRPSKRAGHCRAGRGHVSTCRRRDRLIAPRGRCDGKGPPILATAVTDYRHASGYRNHRRSAAPSRRHARAPIIALLHEAP